MFSCEFLKISKNTFSYTTPLVAAATFPYNTDRNTTGSSSTAQKMKFSIKYLFSKCDQIRRNCRFGHIYWSNP